MPSVTPTFSQVGQGDNSAVLYTWVLTTANPVGVPIDDAHLNLNACYVTASATWGGATLAWQAGNDGSNLYTASNAAGATAATLTANGGMQITECGRYRGPTLTVAGSGATVTVLALLTRSQPGRT